MAAIPLYCCYKVWFSVLIVVFGLGSSAEGDLSSNWYDTSCPKALSTIRNAVVNAVYKEHRMGASLLRLHFHDCFVNGCDASVLLDDTSSFTGEKTAAANINSLRGFEVIDDIKSQLESLCPGVVSCADILAVAARDSVVSLGGPSWTVGLGRRDSTTANKDTATQDIPSPLMDLTALISAFSNKGFTTKEMVVLSGAHTTGEARCQLFRGRLYNESSMDTEFSTSVKSKCPSLGNDDTLSPLDVTTNVLFDNAYFKNLVNKKGLLHSDQQLYSGASTDSLVTAYSTNPTAFRDDFAAAMLKMANLTPLTGSTGQIRINCRNLN